MSGYCVARYSRNSSDLAYVSAAVSAVAAPTPETATSLATPPPPKPASAPAANPALPGTPTRRESTMPSHAMDASVVVSSPSPSTSRTARTSFSTLFQSTWMYPRCCSICAVMKPAPARTRPMLVPARMAFPAAYPAMEPKPRCAPNAPAFCSTSSVVGISPRPLVIVPIYFYLFAPGRLPRTGWRRS